MNTTTPTPRATTDVVLPAWIGGRAVHGAGDHLLPLIDPATGDVSGHSTLCGPHEVDAAVRAAAGAIFHTAIISG